jgi:DNA ligase-1
MQFPGVVSFDGEVYNHQFKDDFNTIVSLVKQGKPTAEDLARAKEMVEYHVYDVITKQPMSFDSRWKLLTEIFKTVELSQIKLVQTSKVDTQEELDDLMGAYLEDGYEGQMVRDRRANYENKRTDKLLKRKEFVDAEWPIIGYKEGKGNRQGCIILRCVNAEGSEFDCSVKGSVDYTRKLWARRESLVGHMATIKYQRLTPDGIPKFLTCIKFKTTGGEDLSIV